MADNWLDDKHNPLRDFAVMKSAMLAHVGWGTSLVQEAARVEATIVDICENFELDEAKFLRQFLNVLPKTTLSGAQLLDLAKARLKMGLDPFTEEEIG
jgi:hypothetical protein